MTPFRSYAYWIIVIFHESLAFQNSLPRLLFDLLHYLLTQIIGTFYHILIVFFTYVLFTSYDFFDYSLNLFI